MEEHCIFQFEGEKAFWFNEAIIPELLDMDHTTFFTDLLNPEILASSAVATKSTGSFLRKSSTELLANFILKHKPLSSVDAWHSSIITLCKSVPQLASSFREALVLRRTYANMVIQITVEVVKDELDFFTRILFTDMEISRWMLLFIKLSGERVTQIGLPLPEVEKVPKHLEKLCKALYIDAQATFIDSGWSFHLYCHLKLFCVLVSAGGLQPKQEEVIFWLRALACLSDAAGAPPKVPACKNPISKRRLELGIAFMCLVPGLRSSSTVNLYQDCIRFLLGPAISGLISYEQGSVIAVWLAVQLLLQCYSHVSEFVSKAIGMDLTVDRICWRDLCHIAHETGITSDTHKVVKAASCLRATGPICSIKSDQLVLKCLLQLLKSGHFVRCRIDITEAIMHCILLATEPVHPIIVELIKLFAEASYIPATMSTSDGYSMGLLPCGFLAAAIKPLSSCPAILETIPRDETRKLAASHESIKASNQPSCSESTVHAILASFYILFTEQLQKTAGIFTGFKYGSLAATHGQEIWWSKLLMSLPLENLLAYMEARWFSYEHIFPQWVDLAVSLFPERLLVSRLVRGLACPEGVSIIRERVFSVADDLLGLCRKDLSHLVLINEREDNRIGFGRTSSVEMARQVFKSSLVNFIPALKLLKAIHLQKISPEIRFELQVAVVEDLLPLLLDKSCSKLLQDAFCEWWRGLEHVNVDLLVPLFFRSIKLLSMDVDEANIMQKQNLEIPHSAHELDILSNLYQELVEQPLSLLACREEIYHTPLMSIFLDLMTELLVKNRKMCFVASIEDKVKKEEISRALDTRDSAVCQILLENWSGMLSDKTIENDLVLKAGRQICAFISSIFYSNPVILRLVHFQGYDLKLVPAVVEGVTQMVHFLEFFEEFLKFLQLPVLSFGIVLISNIVRRHPGYSQSFTAAQKAIKHVKGISLEDITISMGEIMESMAWFAVTFPVLQSEVREYLQGCLKVIDSGTISTEVQSAAVTALRLLQQ